MSVEIILLEKNGTFRKAIYDTKKNVVTIDGEVVQTKKSQILTKELLKSMYAELDGINLEEHEIYIYVTKKFNINIEDLSKNVRKQEIVLARDTCMYLLRKKYMFSLTSIGARFYKDHATVLHAMSVIDNILTNENDIYHLLIKDIINKFIPQKTNENEK